MMEKIVDGETIDGAMVLTEKGSILTAWGFDDLSPKVVSAISANIWSHFEYLGKLQTLLFEAEKGLLALANLSESACFVALYTRRKDHGRLLQRLDETRIRICADPVARDAEGADELLEKASRRSSPRVSETNDDDDDPDKDNTAPISSSEQSKAC